MDNKNSNSDILVIGEGMAGIEASLTLAKSDRKVHLIEKTSYTGVSLVSIIIYWLTIALVYVTFEVPYSAIPFWILFGMSYAYLYKPENENISSS